MEISRRGAQRLWPLRAVTLIPAVATYCVRNAGQLFILVWFPCLVVLACQVALDWLVLGVLSDWLTSENFDLRAWLTAVAVTPGGAMAWAFVLSHMADRNSSRGLVTAGVLRRAQGRSELSREVFLVAVIFTAVNLLDFGIRLAQFQLLGGLDLAFELSDAGTVIWDRLIDAIRIPAMAAFTAWAYLVAGHLLRTGTIDVAYVWTHIRGKQRRLIVLFLVLNLAVIALDRIVAPAIAWLIQAADPMEAAMMGHLADSPFFAVWTVVYAVTVGFVLDVLERREPPVNSERRATKPG